MGVGSARFVVVMWPGLVFRVGERSASLVVVVWSSGLVCRVGEKSTRLVVVMWPVGLVWIVECCFHVPLEFVVGPKW